MSHVNVRFHPSPTALYKASSPSTQNPQKSTNSALQTRRNMKIPTALLLLMLSCAVLTASAGNFDQDFDFLWGNGRGKTYANGNYLTLSLDRVSGSGFKSRRQYLYGKIDMKLKLVPGNSAGTVTTYYLSSVGWNHDEIDFEFLGNLSGQPYTMHTNIYTQGKGNREQQFHLWFDPTTAFHTYSILWNPRTIIFSVDGTPIRQFKNLESKGIGFPRNQPMWIYSSLWNADEWATRGGLIKTDWSKAPFVATFTGFNALSCSSVASCFQNSWFSQSLDVAGEQRMRWIQRNYMIYNYCTDYKRFPGGFPPECSLQ